MTEELPYPSWAVQLPAPFLSGSLPTQQAAGAGPTRRASAARSILTRPQAPPQAPGGSSVHRKEAVGAGLLAS